MFRLNDALHCLSITFFAALIGLSSWGFIYYSTVSFRQSRELKLPKDKIAVASITAEIEYDSKMLTLSGQLRCRPRPLAKGMDYQCLFDSFSLRDGAGTLLLAFERNPDKNCRYTVDPRLSPVEREALFNAFHIDTTSHDYSADRSLLQQPFTLFVSPRGQIKEVGLPPALRNALHAYLNGSASDPIVKTLVNAPHRLPPLYSKKGHKKRWTTEGNFFSPLTFYHQAKTQGEQTTITTHSSVQNAETLSVNDWHLSCKIEGQILKELHFDLCLGTDHDFFNHHTSHRYHITGEVALTYDAFSRDQAV